MLIAFILMVSVFQLIVYFFSDRYNLKFLKIILFGFLVSCNFIFFPKYFLPKFINEDGANCGIPQMAVFFGFWLIGNGMLIVTHLCYYLTKKFIFRKK